VTSVQFNLDRDSSFLHRSEAWLSAKAGAGAVVAFPHRLGPDEQRLWYFWNPHPAATREHHEFEQQAVARIHEEIKSLPNHNPSAQFQ